MWYFKNNEVHFDQKNDGHIPPAGKMEKISEGRPFLHFFVSQNTENLQANDPFIVNQQESLRMEVNTSWLPNDFNLITIYIDRYKFVMEL
jgi:hypothetical protein